MNAIVTGGAGFIGSHMVDLLVDRGFYVTVIDNFATGRRENLKQHLGDPRVSIQEMNMRRLTASTSLFAGCDYVFHFGGIGDIVPSIERPLDYMCANVDGTLAVLEAARHAGVRKFVYAASSSCYGDSPVVPTPEHAPIAPQYPYALSKYLGECAALHWAQVYGLPVISIRMFNVYGPRVRTTGAYGAVFGIFLAQKRKGHPFTVVGDGTQTRDFVFVADVTKAFLLAAESPHAGEVFNLGAGQPHSVNHLVELLGGPVTHVPKRPGEPDCTWADIRKIRDLLSWSPQVSFEEGVSVMLDRIGDWADAPLWTSASIEAATKAWFDHLSPGVTRRGGTS